MPNFNPFSNDVEDTSFERGLPVNQAAKTVAKTASVQTDKAIEQANKDIIDQLYGPSNGPVQGQHTDEVVLDQLGLIIPQEQGTDEANPTHVNHSNAASRAAAHAAQAKSSNPNLTPEEQANMEKIRHELFGNYGATFRQAGQNGAHGLITGLDQEMEKARKEREQQEAQKKKDEEEEEQRKDEEEEKEQQELVTPAGKKTGVMFGKKQQEPMALRLAKTKTEGNRGTSG